MKFSLIAFQLLFLFSSNLFAQTDLTVYPTNWWVGMKNPRLQLMIHSDHDIAVNKLVFKSSSKDVKIIKVNKTENRHYLFVDVEIAANAKPQTVKFSFGGIKANDWQSFQYHFYARSKENGKTRIQGVTSKDFIYLLMPDRFSNGDTTNDFFTDMRDTGHDRNNPFDRHGGDLQGVINHLDYLKELGVTSIWMTPVTENDMSRTQEANTSRSTYHGYAFTDQYSVDRRFGGNEMYKKYVAAAHSKGLKVIQDAVYNHIGIDHWFIRDLPMKDWINQWPEYTNTNYKDQPIVDPYASAYDKKLSVDGWFTPFMADLNQQNPFVANFLIQYAIWSTEEFGIDGWRVDTYFYSDAEFLNKINTAILNEFPKLTVFGEAWVSSVVNSAYFSQNNFTIPFKHNLQGVTDFPLAFAMIDALNEPFGWTEGVNKIYMTLAQDIAYKDPNRNCIFLDNHDLDRIYSVIGEDIDKYKMSMNWLLTLRGIPQLYYGTEILMKNFKNPTDAEVRKDFPGGWPEDKENKFLTAGRTAVENEAYNYISRLANYRKKSSAITNGKLMQFIPVDGVYVYFRYDKKQTVMVISNTGAKEMKIDSNRFSERMKGYTKVKDVITGKVFSVNNFEIKPKESFVFELLK